MKIIEIKKILIASFKNLALILLIFGSSPFQGQAQTLELGALVGGSNYQGDLASSEFNVLKQQINFGVGGFLRYNFNDQLSLRLQILSTDLVGEDSLSSFPRIQQRNLRFFSPLLDASLRVEWHPLATIFDSESIVSPYIALGGSFFTFNPQAEYEGVTYELQPLRTEGQGIPGYNVERYELYNFSALLGGGVKFKLNEDFTIGLEVVAHYTFTDYLDDVSNIYAEYDDLIVETGVIAANLAYQADDFFGTTQGSPIRGTVRGNPNNNDLFLMGGITISYSIINPDRLGGSRRAMGCPTF